MTDPKAGIEAEAEYISIGEAPIAEAKRLQSLLEARGVRLQLASDPEACNSCSPKIAMYVRAVDAQVVRDLFSEEHARSLGDLKQEAHLADAVFDAEKAEATCPACGMVFSTQLTECPDCGLGFGG